MQKLKMSNSNFRVTFVTKVSTSPAKLIFSGSSLRFKPAYKPKFQLPPTFLFFGLKPTNLLFSNSVQNYFLPMEKSKIFVFISGALQFETSCARLENLELCISPSAQRRRMGTNRTRSCTFPRQNKTFRIDSSASSGCRPQT